MITIPARAGPIAFAGTSAFAARVLRGLVSESLVPALVVTQPDRPAGRRRVVTPPPVASAASEIGLPLIQPERASEAGPALIAAGVGAVAICAYGNLIPPSLLIERPWVNLHPSALPRWRGAAPIERAIMAGDSRTEVCVMLLVEALDAGPVMARIGGGDTTRRHDRNPLRSSGRSRRSAARRGTAPDRCRSRHRGGAAPGGRNLRTQARAERPRARPRPPSTWRARSHPGARARNRRPDRLGRQAADRLAGRRGRRRRGRGRVSARAGRLVVGFADGAVELLDVQVPGRSRLEAASFLRGLSGPIERATAG